MADAEKIAADSDVYGFDQSDQQVMWRRGGRVPLTFRLRRYLAGFIFAMLPPITGKTIFAWLWLRPPNAESQELTNQVTRK